MANKELGLFGFIVILLAVLVVGILFITQTPKDERIGSKIVIGYGNLIVWIVVIIFLVMAIIGIIIGLKKFGAFDDLFSGTRI